MARPVLIRTGMLTEIAPSLLQEVTGGGARIASQKSSQGDGLLMLVQNLLTQLQAQSKSQTDPLKMMAMMIAMKKGDTQGALAALGGGGGGGGGDKKPEAETKTA